MLKEVKDMDIFILVNEGLVSVFEVFIGVLKDYYKVKVYGLKIFGKGVV